MKKHTIDFKNAINQNGRELDAIIQYVMNGQEITLTGDDIYSVTPVFHADILKSAMKELNFDSEIQIPKNTIIRFKFGTKIDDNYEYLDYGNYVIYSNEYNADTQSYSHICYDKLLYSMKTYEELNVTYPITISNYIDALCERIGIDFADKNTTFANCNKIIQNELYIDLGYTYRDVLDELAQVTASTICLNLDDKLEIRYFKETNEVINEDFLKDKNVTIKKKYGPINSIVLSRSAETDNIYLKDDVSVFENGLCEIKIKDNQIMNWNDRDTYLLDIYNQLNGLEYYTNDFDSPGICYFDICDKYKISIDGINYDCVMLNDEIKINKGLYETIYTEMPIQGETDYKKADKTDRRLKQTYLIVDKQNQKIDSVVNNVSEQDKKITQITQTVDTIQQLVSGEYGLDRETSISKTIHIDNAMETKPLDVKIYGYSRPYLAYYPGIDYLGLSYLVSNKEVEIKKITLCVDKQSQNKPSSELKQVELNILKPLRSLKNIKDELHISFNDETEVLEAKITRYLDYIDGQVIQLSKPTVEIIPIMDFQLFEKENYIYIKENCNYDLYLRYLVYSEINNLFATKKELKSSIIQTEDSILNTVEAKYISDSKLTTAMSEIKQTTDAITSTVSQKVGKNEIISQINQSPEQIVIDANKIGLKGKQIDMTGTVFVNGVLNGTVLNLNDDGTSQTAPITINYGTQKKTTISSDGIEHYTDNYFFVLGNQQVQGPYGYINVKTFKFGNYQNNSFFEVVMDSTGQYGSGIFFKNNGKTLLSIGEENELITQRDIYTNDSGNAGEVILDISVQTVKKIDIYYCDNNGKECGTQTVYNPQGEYVTLTAQEVSGATSGFIRSSEYNISANRITPILSKCGYMRNSNGTWAIVNGTNYLKIKKVVAYFNN